jgi:curved DNA-binding protein CbpA
VSDLYAVLGVAHDADTRTIRQAYRRLARRHHPDSGGDMRQMIGINEAWGVLNQPERRASYDAELGRPTAPKPPSARDGHTVLDFGRYQGWSLHDIAARDDDYLEWLRRTPTGRPLQREIAEILARRELAMAALRPASVAANGRWRRR